MPKNHHKETRNRNAESDSTSRLSGHEWFSPDESEKIEKLLLADWGDRWSAPLTAGELLELGKDAFEPLFYEPPLGPIPKYLRLHSLRHGCVTDYEEKLEEIERWKAGKLNSWLNHRVGKKCCIGPNVYELCLEKQRSTAPEKYRFERIGQL
jgi:hypothetical protein